MATPRKRSIINHLANLPVLTDLQRARLLRSAGVFAGPGTGIAEGFRIAGEHTLRLGRDCYLNHGAYVDCVADVVFGDNSGMGPGAKVLTSHHDWDLSQERIFGPTVPKAVTIGDNVWIAANAVVLPGVVIEDTCIIAAGAVVNRRCRSGGVYAGVPATRVAELRR